MITQYSDENAFTVLGNSIGTGLDMWAVKKVILILLMIQKMAIIAGGFGGKDAAAEE
jgi:hypothetical protein